VVPELTGEVNFSGPGGHHRRRRVSVAKTAGNKLLSRLQPESADQGEEIVGGGPLNKGVIPLLYAGTGRESRTISGPRAAAERDHVESATPTGG
jgi:hypothetical protein